MNKNNSQLYNNQILSVKTLIILKLKKLNIYIIQHTG